MLKIHANLKWATIVDRANKKLGEIPSVFDWNCPTNGTSDCSIAINTAIVAMYA